jgi:hypothetical protein
MHLRSFDRAMLTRVGSVENTQTSIYLYGYELDEETGLYRHHRRYSCLPHIGLSTHDMDFPRRWKVMYIDGNDVLLNVWEVDSDISLAFDPFA